MPEMTWPMRILLGAFIFGIIGIFTAVGVVTPGMRWFLYVFLIPFWAMFPLVIIGTKATLMVFLIYIVGYPVTKLLLARTGWYAKAAQEMKIKGSTSSGGFSGGGGSSGGGGASGSW